MELSIGLYCCFNMRVAMCLLHQHGPVSSTRAELSVDLLSMISSLFPVSVNTDSRLCIVIRAHTHIQTDRQGLSGARMIADSDNRFGHDRLGQHCGFYGITVEGFV